LGKRTKPETSVVAHVMTTQEQYAATAQQAYEWRRKRENKLRELEKSIAEILDVEVVWSEEHEYWYYQDAAPAQGADAEDGRMFCPLNDPELAISLLSKFHLSTEHVPGSFLVASAGTNGGKRVYVKAEGTDPSQIMEAICLASVQLARM
jgi:hypothetical protein